MIVTMTLAVAKHHLPYLEENMKFHSAIGIDSFVVMLHDFSRKQTEEASNIVAKYNCHLLTNNDPVFRGDSMRTELARDAISHYKSDWIINNDVDEFWVIDDSSINKFFDRYPSNNLVYVERYNVLPYMVDFSTYVSPARSYIYTITKPLNVDVSVGYDRISPIDFSLKSKSGKTAHRGSGLIKVHRGSHLIEIENPSGTTSQSATIFHYPYSTKENFVNELNSRIDAMLSEEGLKENQSFHIRYWKHYRDTGRINELLNGLFPSSEIVSELCRKGIVTQSTRVKELLDSLELK